MQKIIYASVLLALATFFACKKQAFNRPVKYVAYVGFNYKDFARDSANNYLDTLHIVTLKTYLERINSHYDSAFYKVEYRLKTFQCDYEEKNIPLIYNEILADTNIALVVDNTWGKYIRNADTIIGKGIPVISMSADKNRLPFGGNAIFLQPNDPQPSYLVKFIANVLKAKHVGFVTECDYQLHDLFVEDMENRLDYDTVCLWQKNYIDNREVPKEAVAVMEKSLRKMLNQPDPDVVLLNSHTGYGDSIMRFLETENLLPKTFVGISTSLTDKELQHISMEKGHTFIRFQADDEALPEKVYQDKKIIVKRLPDPFRRQKDETEEQKMKRVKQVENNIRRCFDAMNIFETALRAGCRDRAALAGYFKNTLRRKKVMLFNELYAFDSTTLILKREPYFEQVKGGKTQSCPTQLNTDGKAIPNLHVGIDIVDINDIDIRANTFDCNLLYWVIAEKKYIEKEGYIDFPNISSEEGNRYQIVQEERDSNYMVHINRISGKFLGNFKSFDFPFDHHEIIIPVAALSSSNDIKISFDYSRLQINDKIKEFQMNDWDTEEYFVTLDNQLTNAIGSAEKVTFDPEDKARFLEKHKILNVHLKVRRQPWGAIILIVLPFMMFSALPIFMLFFHKASFEEVGELIITSFLATVAYSINLVQISPATDSMNLAYIFLMLTLGINFFCFIYVTYIDRRKKTATATTAKNGKRKIFRLSSRIWIPYLLLILLLMLFYLIFSP